MAIDASIYSQIQKPEFESPINAMAKVAQYQNAQNQNALAQYKLNSAQREDSQNTAISNAYKNALGPDGKIDRASLFTNLASQGAGAKIPEYQKTFADQDKASAETQKTQVQVLQEVNGLVGSAAGALKSNPTPQNAQFLISNLKNKLGPDLSTKAGLDNLQIPTDPQEIYQWADTHYLNAQAVDKKLAAETQIKTTQMNNDTSRTNNQETNATSRANNAATVGATIRSQNMNDARQREQFNAPQYMETDQGLVALPKKLAAGQMPTATPVKGADGNPLSKPLKDIPATVNTAIIANKQSLSQLDRTIKLLEGKSVDGQTGDANATGYKGYLPQGILNRMDTSGIDARAGVADIGSLKLHDRSGAAVTASESPRLMPFIPTATDDNATALKKLKRLKQEVQSESNAMGEVYSKGQGYKANPLLQSQVGGGDIHAQADAILKGK